MVALFWYIKSISASFYRCVVPSYNLKIQENSKNSFLEHKFIVISELMTAKDSLVLLYCIIMNKADKFNLHTNTYTYFYVIITTLHSFKYFKV